MYRLPYPRSVSTLAYVVQPGDSVESITAKYVDWRRWPELVSANQMHKRLVPAKDRGAYLVFESLDPGEQLFIPGSWVAGSGAVGCSDPMGYCSQPGFGKCNCGCGAVGGPYDNLQPANPSPSDILKGSGQGSGMGPGGSDIIVNVGGNQTSVPPDVINQPDPNQIPQGPGAQSGGNGQWYIPGGLHTQPGGSQASPPGKFQPQMPGHGGQYMPMNPNQEAPTYDPFAAVPAAIAAAMPAVQVLINQTQPGWQIPTGYQPIDLGNVIAGWLPYLPNVATPTGGQPTTPATPWPTDPTKWDPAVLMRLVVQAAALLQMAGIQPTDVFTRIPWDQVPWGSFPWSSLPPNWWLIFAKVPGSPPRQPPIIVNDTGTQAMSLATNNTPNVLTIDLSSAGPLGDVKWDGISDQLDPVLMQDPRIQACLAAPGGTARLAQMVLKKDCFVGASADKILKYLCKNPIDGSYADLDTACQSEQVCTAGTQYDPTTGACVPAVPGGKLPDWYSQINWACMTPPQCWFDQIAAKVPEAQRCPPPGTEWPGCVPDWLKQQYGMTLPTVPGQQPPATKTEEKSNTALYVGLGIGAVVLLGGAAWMLSRPSAPASEEQATANPAEPMGLRGLAALDAHFHRGEPLYVHTQHGWKPIGQLNYAAARYDWTHRIRKAATIYGARPGRANPVATFEQYAEHMRRQYPGRYTHEQIVALYDAKVTLAKRHASPKPSSRAKKRAR
jgi:hypothetical protein